MLRVVHIEAMHYFDIARIRIEQHASNSSLLLMGETAANRNKQAREQQAKFACCPEE
jgi:hypothetical protein